MWVATTRGFYSAVAHRDRPGWIIVRGRSRSDLVALYALIDEHILDDRAPRMYPLEETPAADYSYRMTVPVDVWARALELLARDVDYDNFKNAVSRRQGPERASIYHRVWSTLLAIQLPRPATFRGGRGDMLFGDVTDECICASGAPDRFGNRDQLLHPDCPTCS